MPVLANIGLLVTPVPGTRQGVLHTVANAAIAWVDGRIAWLGTSDALPSRHRDDIVHSAEGGLVIPGLVDCHTHLAFGGWRADEFEQRILGRSYAEIARSGGGVQRTVTLTRQASSTDLLSRCVSHLRQMVLLGVTTVECKSGYGLLPEEEIRLLEVYRDLRSSQPARIVPTLLAHAIPEEYAGRREEFIDVFCRQLVPEVSARGLARFCDVFVEDLAFSVDEARAILDAAARRGLGAKVHADQFGDSGAASLAAEVGAASADHLEHASREGIRRLAESGTVAVSLPLASLYLGRPALDARLLMDAGVPVAVASDFNPGTAPSYHLPLAMMLACTLQRMTPSEALWGATTGAAMALDLHHEIGTLEVGYLADLAVIDAPDVDHWLYHFRASACTQTWIGGRRMH